eukprot:403362918
MLYPGILFQKKFSLFELRQWDLFMINLGFNLGNLVGRTLSRLKSSYSRIYLVLTCLSRGIIIATTFLIGLKNSEIWSHPAMVILNSFLVGLSGGLFSVAASSSFHARLKNKEKEYGGYVISVMLNLGIASGSLISLLAFQPIFK